MPEPRCRKIETAAMCMVKAAPIFYLAFVSFIAGRGGSNYLANYSTLITVGLIFCSGGDIFLEMEAEAEGPREDLFVYGLASFLVGHLFYIAAFHTGLHFVSMLPFYGYGLMMFFLLWDNIPDKMLGPVFGYAMVIATMAHKAWARSDTKIGTSTSQSYAIAGAFIFVLSDSIIAWNKFGGKDMPPIPNGKLWVMLTYYTAQLFISASVVEEPPAVADADTKAPGDATAAKAEGKKDK